MWITFDNEISNLPLTFDGLTQSKKKGQAALFCPLKHSFNAYTTKFNIVSFIQYLGSRVLGFPTN
jgi:hypothetical protein